MADRSTEPDPTRLEGWGRHPAVEAPERVSENLERSADGATLARGMGRSYGDASLPAPGGIAVGTRLGDRVLAFDESTGVLHAEAGLTLHALTWLFLPRGWSSPTLPGTAYITLGGMVAADVHGKEHHVRGTFGRHVERLKIRLADGRIIWASRQEEPELFFATLGGMGLTGHVLEVVVRLHRVPSTWVVQETERHPDLASFVEGLALAAEAWEFTMGWIDCLKRGPSMGRGILFRGRWADPAQGDVLPASAPTKKLRLSMPVDVPSFLLNKLSVAAFNETLYRKHGDRVQRGIVHPEEFFHPLDKILHWNRGYGGPGFTQYQCVVPTRDGARRVLEELTRRGAASFLCVLKDCGEEGEGMLSFPRPGTSIAVDLPVRRDTADIVAQLNRRVIAEGGRIYLAKDTFTTAADFRAMDGERLDQFLAVRRRFDPDAHLSSVLSRRLFGD